MFMRSIPLFNLFGFQVRLDPSWLFLAFLLVWALSQGMFPYFYPGLSSAVYFWMGIISVIGLFGCIVLHEFGHAWVAQRFGLPMRGITLFLFGGVAEMGDESPSPKAELWMALAGPAVSVLLLLIFLGLSTIGDAHEWPEPIVATLTYLAFMNGILIVFNLVPAFPLDGGRVLRALLWQWKKSLRWATRIASNCGKWFGLLLIFLGGLNILQGEFISGIWWVLIGLFLRQAADASYQQVLLKRYIEGIPVKQLMRTDVVTVPAETSIRRLIDNYFYHHYFKGYPVVEGDSLVGYVSLPEIRQLSLENREQKTVREVMTPPSDTNTIQADADTMLALARMRDTGTSTLLVTDSENRLVGLISLKDLLHFFAMKIELEENGKQ